MNTRMTQKGVLLLESVVAAVVVAAGVVGVLKLQAQLMSNAAEAKVRSEATSLAQAKLDDLRDSMLSAEHFASGASCAAGTRVQSGSDTPTASGSGTYSRSWTVTPNCAPPRHQVQVNVSWGSGNVTINSVIAWNDPAKATTIFGSTGGSGGSLGTPSTATLINNAPLIDNLPTGSSPVRNDGTATYFDSSTNTYSLYRQVGAKYQLVMESTVALIPLSGLVAAHSSLSLNITRVNVEGSEAVFCTPLLRFGDENDPSTYGVGGGSSSSDRAGAYVCYAPTGWAGTLSVFEKSTSCGYQLFENKNTGGCDFTKALACPELTTGTAVLSGQRTVKVLLQDSAGNITGQSGILPRHSTMAMPNYPSLKRTQRLDFVIYDPGSGGSSRACASIFPNAGSQITGTVNTKNYSVMLRTGAGTSSSVIYGIPSIRYPHYVIEALSATVSGTLTGSCTPSAVGTSGNADYVCTVASGNYSCLVPIGWSGNITSGSVTVAVTSVPASGSSGVNFTCP